MRDEGLYLEDIVDAAEALTHFVIGISKDEFACNDLVNTAVIHKLQIIGEAAAHVSAETRNLHPEIEWAKLVGFRSIAVHAYFAVDWSIVWNAATRNVPILREQVARILAEEFPDADTDNCKL